MGSLAAFLRQRLRGRVIAVAGSNGKTGTKLLIDAVLRPTLRGSISPKSFNNNVGVPLAIFPADPGHDYLVLELGTNHPGEIAELTRIAAPDISVITNAGDEHLEGLGDIAGVRRENAAIIQGMNADGLLIVNGDDSDLVAAVAAYPGRRVTFGTDPSNDLFATDVEGDESGVRFRINGAEQAFVPLLGVHTACNALAAVAVGREMGLNFEQMIDGLHGATGPDMRLQLQRSGQVTVVNDCYNANPSSMRAGLGTLAMLKNGTRRVAVLGDMLELGAISAQRHREMGELAGSYRLDLLACVGPHSADYARRPFSRHGLRLHPAISRFDSGGGKSARCAFSRGPGPAQGIPWHASGARRRGDCSPIWIGAGQPMIYLIVNHLLHHPDAWVRAHHLGFLRVFRDVPVSRDREPPDGVHALHLAGARVHSPGCALEDRRSRSIRSGGAG